MGKIVISGTGLYTPPYAISNEELVDAYNQYADWHNLHFPEKQLLYSSVDFILKASGIKNRYVVEKTGILDIHTMHPIIPKRAIHQLSLQCDIALSAANQAILNANISPQSINMVIVACSNMERPYPAIAIELQHALNLQGFAYDLNVACSSATFGIQAAMNALQTGNANTVLMVNPEICSAHLNFRDRDCHFIFGDACTAVILQKEEDVYSTSAFSILSTQLKTEFSNNIRNNFGFLNRCELNGVPDTEKLFMQQGRKVFKEVVPLVFDLIMEHLKKAKISIKQLKRLWLHQANINMNQLIARKIYDREPTQDEAPSILHEYANTSSAGSIIAFHQFRNDFKRGDIGLLCSFGAGYSVGSVLVQRE